MFSRRVLELILSSRLFHALSTITDKGDEGKLYIFIVISSGQENPYLRVSTHPCLILGRLRIFTIYCCSLGSSLFVWSPDLYLQAAPLVQFWLGYQTHIVLPNENLFLLFLSPCFSMSMYEFVMLILFGACWNAYS